MIALKTWGRPVSEMGCGQCGTTIHRYEGHEEVGSRPHLWTCTECGSSHHSDRGPKLSIPFVEMKHEKSDVHQESKIREI
jgi:hypothetical protein